MIFCSELNKNTRVLLLSLCISVLQIGCSRDKSSDSPLGLSDREKSRLSTEERKALLDDDRKNDLIPNKPSTEQVMAAVLADCRSAVWDSQDEEEKVHLRLVSHVFMLKKIRLAMVLDQSTIELKGTSIEGNKATVLVEFRGFCQDLGMPLFQTKIHFRHYDTGWKRDKCETAELIPGRHIKRSEEITTMLKKNGIINK